MIEPCKSNTQSRKYFWKHKRVSEKVYNKRLKQVELARTLKREGGKFVSRQPQKAKTKTNVDGRHGEISDSSGVEGEPLGTKSFCKK